MGLLSFGGLMLVWLEAPVLATGFLSRGWPLVIVSLACGIGSLVELWRSNFTRATFAASGAVAAVIWGWGISQYPAIVPPHITGTIAKAPNHVLWVMLVVIGCGAVLLLPALGYLFFLFKTNPKLATRKAHS
jgi:cytochrome d ubiquinol oxidase subunit II